MRIFKTFIVGLLLMGSIFSVGNSMQNNYTVYASLMYHFGKFIQWPPPKNSGNFVVGVYGAGELFSSLTDLAKSKKIGNRSITVKKMTGVSGGGDCNILFIGESKKKEISNASTSLKGKGVLIVTESSGAINSGSIVNFVQRNGRVAFQLNLPEADKQGVKISSELQKLAVK